MSVCCMQGNRVNFPNRTVDGSKIHQLRTWELLHSIRMLVGISLSNLFEPSMLSGFFCEQKSQKTHGKSHVPGNNSVRDNYVFSHHLGEVDFISSQDSGQNLFELFDLHQIVGEISQVFSPNLCFAFLPRVFL